MKPLQGCCKPETHLAQGAEKRVDGFRLEDLGFVASGYSVLGSDSLNLEKKWGCEFRTPKEVRLHVHGICICLGSSCSPRSM